MWYRGYVLCCKIEGSLHVYFITMQRNSNPAGLCQAAYSALRRTPLWEMINVSLYYTYKLMVLFSFSKSERMIKHINKVELLKLHFFLLHCFKERLSINFDPHGYMWSCMHIWEKNQGRKLWQTSWEGSLSQCNKESHPPPICTYLSPPKSADN